MPSDIPLHDKAKAALRKNLKVVVLLGGDSAEREVSLQSGQAVESSLKGVGYQVGTLDPSIRSIREYRWQNNEIAFNALHGTYGEDGTLQKELTSLRIPFTGSDSASSALAFDKIKSKQIFRKSGLLTPDFLALSATDSNSLHQIAAEKIGFPLVVKPVRQGSSLGVSVVDGPSSLDSALRKASQFGKETFIEQAILGEEWTVAVLDGQPLPPIRISSQTDFFDYSAKYQDEQTRYEVFDLGDSPIAQSVADLAVKASQAIGTCGMSRVDLMVDRDGQPWLLEVNTSPGMTDHSLVPKSATRLGWSFGELCERILFSALPRFPDLQTFLSAYD